MAKDTKEKQQTNPKMRQEHSARIDALWNKLQKSEKTQFITKGNKADLSPAEKENLMRKNIKKYSDANLNNNINSVGMGMKVDKNFAKLSSKDAKVIEFSSKALEALDKVKDYSAKNPRPYAEVDKYFKRIDNIDKPGLLKKAAIEAGNIGSALASKLSKYVPSLKKRDQGKKEEKTR